MMRRRRAMLCIARVAPLLLLAFALSSLFACRGETGYFYHARSGHNWDSAKNLALAENLSLAHGLRLFVRLQPLHPRPPPPQQSATRPPPPQQSATHPPPPQQSEAAVEYRMYSRFPLGGYALIKLAMWPFEGDLSAKIYAARTLMLAFFCAAALLAFDALRRVLADCCGGGGRVGGRGGGGGRATTDWAAATATLLVFCSNNMLYYSDGVTTEGSVDLFAVLLIFHGMVLHACGGRFAPLVAKTCVALLLGWHVYGLLLAFFVCGVAAQMVLAWRARSEQVPVAVPVACSLARPVALGTIAVVFGAAVLAFNFANEHAAYRGEVPFSELPSVRSLMKRAGQDADFNASHAEQLAWPSFLYWQIRAIGEAVTPAALTLPRFRAGLGALALGALVFGLLRTRLGTAAKTLLGTLALCGFCWALPMRHNAALHAYEDLFHVGVPLALFALAFAQVPKLRGGSWYGGAAAAGAAVLFVTSTALARASAVDTEAVALQRTMLAEFDGIRETTRGHTVFVAYDANLANASPLDVSPAPVFFFLAGSVLQYDGRSRRKAAAPAAHRVPPAAHHSPHRAHAYDFIVVLGDGTELNRPAWSNSAQDPALLTPNNRVALLYDGRSFASVNDFYAHWYGLQDAALGTTVRYPPATPAVGGTQSNRLSDHAPQRDSSGGGHLP